MTKKGHSEIRLVKYEFFSPGSTTPRFKTRLTPLINDTSIFSCFLFVFSAFKVEELQTQLNERLRMLERKMESRSSSRMHRTSPLRIVSITSCIRLTYGFSYLFHILHTRGSCVLVYAFGKDSSVCVGFFCLSRCLWSKRYKGV